MENINPPKTRYLDPRGVMGVTGLGRNGVYNMFNTASFPAVRIGRRLLVREDALHDWLTAQSNAPTDRDAGRGA